MSRTTAQPDAPPTKWQVYEQILRIPYYVIFDRYTDELKAFALTNGRYQELEISDQKIWLPNLDCGLGLWFGTYEGITRLWLRWYNADGWVPTPTEAALREAEISRQQAEAERQRADTERQRAEAERQQAEISRQQAEAERQRADTERQRAEQMAAELEALRRQLQERGINPDELQS